MSKLTKRLSELRAKGTKGDWQYNDECINALPKLLEIIRIQGEALHYFQEHGYSRRVCSQALQECKKIENETHNP